MNDDSKIIKAIKEGDSQAFASLVKKYHNQVASLVYMVMGRNIDVEDITQEVFIRVYQSLPNFKPVVSLYGWIYRITINLCIDEIRKRKVRRLLSLDFLTEDALFNRKDHVSDNPLNSVLMDERKNIIYSALQRLSPEHKIVLTLREYQDMSYNEIAVILGITVKAVKSRIFRARKEMKKLLDKYFEERQ